jgi:exopolyphosphatase/guanosine-5'-triphosphate,3'-diphosphate pyrophosphatase
VRCACVDIGSNTTRLLVADVAAGAAGGVAVVCAQRSFIGLPHGAAGAAVGAERARRLAAVVAGQVALARDHGARRIRIVGTAALRRCRDRDEVVAAVQRAAGLPVTVLTADEEARLAFAGATHGLDVPRDVPLGVADIGGGSSELVAGTLGGGVRWSASVATGSGVLTALHLRSDPPRHEELAAAAGAATTAFAGLRPPPVDLALAVGGSAMSLRRVVGEELTVASLRSGLDLAVSAPAADVAARLGLRPERVRLLAAGLLLLGEASRVLDRPLRLGHGGLREGVVLQEVARGAVG